MSTKVKLPRNEIVKMYIREGFTTVEISEKFDCSPCTVNKRLRSYGIKPSNPNYKHISKSLLKSLYLDKKMSTIKIAKKLNVQKSTINSKLKKYGIKARNHSEAGKCRTDHKETYEISSKKLEDLYHNKNLSMQQIADRFGIKHSSTVYNKFKKHNITSRSLDEGIKLSIPRRSRNIALASIKYPKEPFSENLSEKSYLLGFTMGDLNITKTKYGVTIRMQTTTTKKAQLNLVKSLFEKYTYMSVSKNKKGQYSISCNLHHSFKFLLKYKEKTLPSWINDQNLFLSFISGYIDAEGHFGVSNNIGRFSIASQDKNLIFEIADLLENFHIIVEGPSLVTKKGYVDKRGVSCNSNVWKFEIRNMRELYKFVLLIKPYIKHRKRHDDLLMVENNLLNRTNRINLKEEKLLFN